MIITIWLCFSIWTLHPPDIVKDYILEVKVAPVKSNKGVVRVCLFDSERSFLTKALQCLDIPPSSQSSVTAVFKHLQAGTYALVVYHDINNNGKLDQNLLGLPNEPYGFSNNPSTLFGPPGFAKASIQIESNTFITIKL